MAGLFYAAGTILENNPDKNPTDVFTALFCIFFAANQAGMAFGFGPDMAKAAVASERIFKMIKEPSLIDAFTDDEVNNKKRIESSDQI